MKRAFILILALAVAAVWYLAAQPGKPSDVLRGKPASAEPKRRPRKLNEQERRESVEPNRKAKG